MVTPTRKEILKRARVIEMKDIVGSGLPAITPEDYELKESGAYNVAKRDLMTSQHTEARLQQRRYLDTMASEMRLKIMSKREFRQTEKLMGDVGYKWVNGWGKKKKAKPRHKKKEPIDEKVIYQYKGDPFPITRAELDQMKGSMALSREWSKFNHGIRLDKGRAIERQKAKPKPAFKIPSQIAPKIILAPKKKRRRNHTERSGKTMRSLAKVKGVNVFSFPDDIWKVKRKRKRRRQRNGGNLKKPTACAEK